MAKVITGKAPATITSLSDRLNAGKPSPADQATTLAEKIAGPKK